MSATVCYFLQSHRDPEQIYRLVHTLRRGSPRARIVVQHNYAACPLDPGPLTDLPGVWLLPVSRRQVRADYSCQVEPYLELIGWLEERGISYDWLINLSAQDYPVTPVPAIEVFLGAADADGFVRHWDVRSPASPWPRRKATARYLYRYRRLPPWTAPALRALKPLTRVLPLHVYLDYGELLGMRALSTPFHSGFRCYGGWAWFTLRRAAALYLRDFLIQHPEVARHYRGTVVPEESIVQTVLANSGRFRLVDDDFRYIDYARAFKGSPRTLSVADLPELASGRYHFARKFDLAVDGAVLDRIDQDLLLR